jgi:phosphinothricin acetyltransferase
MILRAATSVDAARVREIYAPHVIDGIATFELELPDEAAMAERIAEAPVWLVAADEAGVVQGYAYARAWRPRAAYQWSVEVSVYLAEGARGRGLGRELLDALLARLGELGFVAAFATIALPNPASEGLFAAAGFDLVGVQRSVGYKLGAWHDVAIGQRLVAGPPPVPAPKLARPAGLG